MTPYSDCHSDLDGGTQYSYIPGTPIPMSVRLSPLTTLFPSRARVPY